MRIKLLLGLLLILTALIAILTMSLWQHTRELYTGAIGQKRAIQLAETIINNRQDLPLYGIFLLADKKWFADQDGTPYQILPCGDGGFEIIYQPRNDTQRLLFPSKPRQKAKIWWTPQAQRIEVESTIEMP